MVNYRAWLEQRVANRHVVLAGEFEHNDRCQFAWLRAGIDLNACHLLLGFEACQPLREGIAEIAQNRPYFTGISTEGSCRDLSSCLSYLRELAEATQAFPLATLVVQRVTDTGQVLRHRNVPPRHLARDPVIVDASSVADPPPGGAGPVMM